MISNKSQPSNIKVFCRFRPEENSNSSKSKLSAIRYESSKELTITPKSDASKSLKFEFDEIFSSNNSSQETLYRTIAKPIIEDVLQGFNGSILAYGQTGSGKTYTITGEDICDPVSMGIVPRLISTVFDHIESSDNNIEFTIKVSFFELYLEKIHDLADISNKNLKIRENSMKGVYIEGLTEHFVSTDCELFELLRIGTQNRHVSYTKMNSKSSRSHSIFSLTVSIHNSIEFSGRTGRLYIVDLAGSERLAKTGTEGLRLKELQNINKSINSLISVINCLTDGKSNYIPYRDSKLTRILNDSLGGNSKTSIIVTCSPLLDNESETIGTLRVGSIAKTIQNKPKRNREPTFAELKLKLVIIEEEIREKGKKIASLEEILKKNNISIDESVVLTEKYEVSDTKIIETDEFLIELEEVSDTLTTYAEENSKLSKTNKIMTQTIEDLTTSKNNQEALISLLKEKQAKVEAAISVKLTNFEKQKIENSLISEKLEKAQSKKIELERTLNEKTAEFEDLKLKLKVFMDRQEPLTNSSDVIEDLKEKLMIEQQKQKKFQIELSELNLRYNIALQDQTISLQNEEKVTLDREIKARNDKIEALQEDIEKIENSHRLVETILNEDEASIKERTEKLEKELNDLACLYKQLISRQSSSNIEKQINLRKIQRLNQKIEGLESEFNEKKSGLAEVEAEANKILDEIAAQSIFNKVRVPIRGGAGKGFRISTFSRLSVKPREYASLRG